LRVDPIPVVLPLTIGAIWQAGSLTGDHHLAQSGVEVHPCSST